MTLQFTAKEVYEITMNNIKHLEESSVDTIDRIIEEIDQQIYRASSERKMHVSLPVDWIQSFIRRIFYIDLSISKTLEIMEMLSEKLKRDTDFYINIHFSNNRNHLYIGWSDADLKTVMNEKGYEHYTDIMKSKQEKLNIEIQNDGTLIDLSTGVKYIPSKEPVENGLAISKKSFSNWFGKKDYDSKFYLLSLTRRMHWLQLNYDDLESTVLGSYNVKKFKYYKPENDWYREIVVGKF